MSSEPGFECDFVDELPKFVRSSCPICLLVLREPHQVTCCGKTFCEACIERVRDTSMVCPACKQGGFFLYPDKGLKQELYGFHVFCSNKSEGCDWQGELGGLSRHLNLDPDVDELLIGCALTRVLCMYCFEHHSRLDIEYHMNSECEERPFTCSLCEEYDSTYDDVITNHTPVCKCRPVECPNSCGANNLQHQHLKEHVSTQCPLSYVDCEFSDAGCDVKVYRKDLSSHLEENMVTHMSLLAKENRKLKEQLRKQAEDLTSLIRTKSAKEKKRFKTLLKEQVCLVQTVNVEMKKKTKKKSTRKKIGSTHTVRKKS